MIAGMHKRPARVQLAYHKLTTQLGSYLSPQERQKLLAIQADSSPFNNFDDNRWLLDMEQEVHKRLEKGYGYA